MHSESTAIALLTLGGVLLAGLAADLIGRRTQLPRVTLLMLLGVSVGPIGLDLFPSHSSAWFPFAADLALVMVAFLLGGACTPDLLRKYGRAVLVVSLAVVGATAAAVGIGLAALGWPIATALLLGAVATSTDPAATADVVREARAEGPTTRLLLGIVAIDDVWGIAVMSVALAVVVGLESPDGARAVALDGVIDLGGAILVGCGLGLPLALLSGRIRDGEPTQAEALGGVFLCGGLALFLDVSMLLAAIAMGVVVANTAGHHRRPFRAIEGIEWPFMVVFFVLSGAALRPAALGHVAGLTVAYLVLRTLGRILGGVLGARVAGGGTVHRGIGIALLPQAGVAIGMALVVSQRVPEVGDSILAATVAGTIVFELLGPIFTRVALRRAGEVLEPSPDGRQIPDGP